MNNREGNRTSDPSEPVDGRDAREGRRRQVTVLFADMVGYTPLAEKLGEEQTYLLMQRVHRELSEAVHAHEGTVQEVTGDGIMALFGAPVPIEHPVLAACRAAIDILQRVDRLGTEIDAEGAVRPAFRIGINTGKLIIGAVGDDQRMEITALGDTVNLAARLQSVAESGEILLSRATHELVSDYVESESAGVREVKGKSKPQEVWRLTAVKSGTSRFDVSRFRGLTPLIGRQQELELLEAQWAEAVSGSVRTVRIVGEPGIGKSRLAYEFFQRLDPKQSRLLEGHCTRGGRETPFLPWIEIVKSSFRIDAGASAQEIELRLVRGMERLGLEPKDHLPYLMNLLGHAPADGSLENIAGEVLGSRTREALLALLRERCRLSPTILFIDDLQWADTATQGLLQRLAQGGENHSLLILCTMRSGTDRQGMDLPASVEIRLAPLSGPAAADLLKQRLKLDSVPESLVRTVTEKAEGNPLFVEELSDFLRERGALEESGDGNEARNVMSALPVTLQDLLMDRFDALEPGPKALLDAASVVGPRFTADLVGATAGLDGDLEMHLSALQAADVIEPVPERRQFRFKHALLQDAVYDSMLTSHRAELHERAATALEAKYAGYPEEGASLLAHHWSQTKRADKAIHYLTLAGRNHLGIYSLDEAAAALQRALDLIEENPGVVDDGTLTDILLLIARVLYFNCDFVSLIGLVDRYLPRVEALGDKRKLARFLFETGYAHIFGAKIPEGRKLLERSKAVAEEVGDELGVAYAELGFMWDRFTWQDPWPGRRVAQREAGERIVDTAMRHKDLWLASKALVTRALDGAAWGWPGEAHADCLRLLTLARETNDPRPRVMGLFALATIHVLQDELDEAVDTADEGLLDALCVVDRRGLQAARISALIMRGDDGDGYEQVRQLIQQYEREGLIVGGNVFFRMIPGVALLKRGEFGKGIKTLEAGARDFVALGSKGAQILSDVFAGEVYLEIALGEDAPSPAGIVSNLGFLLFVFPFAKGRARRRLERGLANLRAVEEGSGWIARGLYHLARLDLARRRQDRAREHLMEALDIARRVEAGALERNIDGLLASLDSRDSRG